MDRNLLLSFMFTTMLLYTSNTLDNEMEGIDKTESIITDTTTTTESFEEFMLKYDLKENKSVNLTIFNFTDPNTTAFDEWFEVSDTAREEGRSIATLIPLIAQKYQSGIFFYLLSPQPDGSCFAGIDYRLNSANFSEYTGISIDLRRQGNNSGFKLFFYDNCSDLFSCPSYESFFEVTSGERQQVDLPFSTFEPYFRGERRTDLPPLNLTQLSHFGIQMYCGKYEQKHQFGPGSLEIFSITAYK
ncbi:hypothetical protein EWB00_005144 [Schistosoma japonicum]|uniref:NADH:ubiquinone oxidoreductase intermediate-associated protein 30 domain-containing protein n=1 Tax=Schistosoma japonicum TaxID=6182 RepID=A0A4Z2D2N1_SCHJA|nr:hypothetical protein EWB00_005144 [Schistosoma japonicum]